MSTPNTDKAAERERLTLALRAASNDLLAAHRTGDLARIRKAYEANERAKEAFVAFMSKTVRMVPFHLVRR
jgi:hypothetical protein